MPILSGTVRKARTSLANSGFLIALTGVIEKLRKFPRLLRVLEVCFLALIGTFFFAYYLFQSDRLLDYDIYFHIAIAELLSQNGWIYNLPWMAYSIHADRYVDFHFIIHYLQVPFVLLTGGDLILAAKLSGLCFLYFSLSAFVFLLQELGTRYRWFWVLFFLLCSPLFTIRLLYLRGSGFFMGLIFLYFYFILKRKFWPVAIICFIGPWTYPGFPLLLVFGGFYWIVLLIEGEKDHRILLVPVIATFLGLVLHPAFPFQFYAFWLELGIHSIQPNGLEPIAEWAPMTKAAVTIGLAIPMVFLSLKIILTRTFIPLEKTFFLTLLFVFFSLFSAQKPIEFFIPVLVVFLALQGSVVIKGNMEKWLPRVIGSVTLVVMIAICLPLTQQFVTAKKQENPTKPFFEAADWIEKHSPPGSKVLLSWADFPLFFYRNKRNIYNNGLNPVYSFGRDFITYSQIHEFFRVPKQGIEYVPIKLDTELAVLNRNHSEGSIFWLSLVPFVKKEFENESFVIFRFPKQPPLPK